MINLMQPSKQQQQGLALISALLALLIIAIIGVALGGGGVLFRKAIVAQEDQTTSLTAAESVLVAVERNILDSQINNPAVLNPTNNSAQRYTSTRSKLNDPSSCSGDSWWANQGCWQSQGLNIITLQNAADVRLSSGGSLDDVNLDLKTSMGLISHPRFRVEVDRTIAGLRPFNAGDNTRGLRLYQITVTSSGRGDGETFLRSVYGVMEN